jgi:hypothetical protein
MHGAPSRQQHQQGNRGGEAGEEGGLGHVRRGSGLAGGLAWMQSHRLEAVAVDHLLRERAVVGREARRVDLGAQVRVLGEHARGNARPRVRERVERERVHHGVERLGAVRDRASRAHVLDQDVGAARERGGGRRKRRLHELVVEAVDARVVDRARASRCRHSAPR